MLEQRVYPEAYIEDPCLLDLDKAWENIYFLLTGCTSSDFENAAAPLSLILFNGTVIDEDQDMGYGPPTYSSPEEVKEIAKACHDFTEETLRSKYESLRSKGTVIYPFDPDSEVMFDYTFDYKNGSALSDCSKK